MDIGRYPFKLWLFDHWSYVSFFRVGGTQPLVNEMFNKVEMYGKMFLTQSFISHVGRWSRSDCFKGAALMSFMTLSAVTGVKPAKLDDGDGEKLGGGIPSVSCRTYATFFPKNNIKSLAQKSVFSDVRVWPS